MIMIALNLLPLFVSKRRSSTGSFQIFFINDDTLLSPPSDTIETEKEGFTVTHLVESVMYVGKEPWHGLERYVRIVFSLHEDKGKELMPKILHLYDHGRGSEMVGNTYWGAYNAVNGYLNYFRGKTQDNTLSSL